MFKKWKIEQVFVAYVCISLMYLVRYSFFQLNMFIILKLGLKGENLNGLEDEKSHQHERISAV